MRKRLRQILPLYGVVPLLCCLCFNQVVYNGARLVMQDGMHFDFSIAAIDGRIPFCSWAIVFYVLAFVFWAVGYVVIARESREVCYEICASDLIAKMFCLLFFLLLPSTMADWPSGTFVLENGFDRLTQLMYNLDQPDNLFPSIHCLESWMVFRGSLRCKKTGKGGYQGFCLLMALAIFASTLLVKQHVFVDVLGGVAVAELGLFLGRKLQAGRIFTLLERKNPLSEQQG